MGCGASKPKPAAAADPKTEAAPPSRTPSKGAGASSKPSAGVGGKGGATCVFVIGSEASPKETVCRQLASELTGVTYLSANELFRDEIKQGTEMGVKLAEMIKAGKIVPAQTLTQLLVDAIGEKKGIFLIDGYPKSLDNLAWLEEQVPPMR